MSIPKSAEGCSRVIRKMRVWALFIGALSLLLILYVKSGYQHKVFKMLDSYKPAIHMVDQDEEPPRTVLCLHEERNGHVIDIELPNEHTFRDALESGCSDDCKSGETREREAKEREARGDSPSLESMV